jgi:hypothetical protein
MSKFLFFFFFFFFFLSIHGHSPLNISLGNKSSQTYGIFNNLHFNKVIIKKSMIFFILYYVIVFYERVVICLYFLILFVFFTVNLDVEYIKYILS